MITRSCGTACAACSRRARVRCRWRGRRRRRGGPARRAARPRRHPDGPADARARRRGGDHRAGQPGHPARVLVLTTYDTDSDVLPAIEAGATGYLLKDAPRAELLRAVRRRPAARRYSPRRWPRRDRAGSGPRPRGASRGQRYDADSLAAGLVSGGAARPTRRLPPCSASARLPSRPTCCTSTPSLASATAPRRSPRASTAAYSNQAAANRRACQGRLTARPDKSRPATPPPRAGHPARTAIPG